MTTPERWAYGPFVVMAHHRSGSNFVNDLLQQHGDIECLNEPLSMHTDFFRDNDLADWHGSDFDPVALHPSMAGETALRAYLHELRRYLLQSRPGRVIGFKDTCLFGKLGWLASFLPGLRVVFLRRDPRAIVSSVLRSELAAFWHYADLVPPAFADLCPGYRSAIDPADPVMRATETAAMSVALRYEMARRTLGPIEHLTVDLETLVADPANGVRALAGFLGAGEDPVAWQFALVRQGESRGGLFSSYRAAEDVEGHWLRHLSLRQLGVIDDVMRAMREASHREAAALESNP